MEIIEWNELDQGSREAALERAPQNRSEKTQLIVSDILKRVSSDGDAAIRELTFQLDGVDLQSFRVTTEERHAAMEGLDVEVREAIDSAYQNIKKFHHAALPSNFSLETSSGVTCQARYLGIQSVGLYAPGGKTPLPSSVLMMGVPAELAKCKNVILCSPPSPSGEIDGAIAYAAEVCGVDAVFKIGGAQAIAAMTFGTESVPACDKLFGPGSIWVTEAKRQVSVGRSATTIDMAAGPSEVMVVADKDANPVFVAVDMAAQMEHGTDSQAILVTESRDLAEAVVQAVLDLLPQLNRRDLIRSSSRYSRIILVDDISQAMQVANLYAAEHLIIQTEDADIRLEQVTAAGSVFLGRWTPEVLGDYCSGTNHVLPTCGLARSVNGLSVSDFMKRITVQRATADGLMGLAKTATTLANAEGLTAHALAVSIRRDGCQSGAVE